MVSMHLFCNFFFLSWWNPWARLGEGEGHQGGRTGHENYRGGGGTFWRKAEESEPLHWTAPGDNIPSESYDDGTSWRGMRCGESSKISSWSSIESNPRTVVYDCVGTKRPTVNLGVWGGQMLGAEEAKPSEVLFSELRSQRHLVWTPAPACPLCDPRAYFLPTRICSVLICKMRMKMSQNCLLGLLWGWNDGIYVTWHMASVQ